MAFGEYKIPPVLLLIVVVALAAAQAACGTGLYWVTMMTVTLLCIGITYNLLGGLATLGGMAVMSLGLWTIGISQFAKVLLWQPADKYIDAPDLTISVYAVFYVCLLLGVSLFSRIRLRLPHPLEPNTLAQSSRLYWTVLPVGLVGLLIFNLTQSYAGANTQGGQNAQHSAGIALEGLVLFAMMVAIDEKIARTEGRHSLGIKVIIPALAVMATGIAITKREITMEPFALYFLACYTRGFRFRRRHLLVGGSFFLLFSLLLSPMLLFMRLQKIGTLPIRERVRAAVGLIENVDWTEVKAAENRALTWQAAYFDYYNRPGLSLLDRFSVIRFDSNLIKAGNGFHYGFATIKNDLLEDIPAFIYKEKPLHDAADYRGRVSGVTTGEGIAEPTFSMISDSFAAFGWMGIVAFGLVVVPCTIALYEGLFDISRPWGTIALLTMLIQMSEGSASKLVAIIIVRTPIMLFGLSYTVGLFSRFAARSSPVPVRGLAGLGAKSSSEVQPT